MRVLICHPENARVMRERIADQVDNPIGHLGVGMPIYESEACPKTVVEWRPPRERFFEYEESDHGWLQDLGMGYMHDTGDLCFQILDVGMTVGGTLRTTRYSPSMPAFVVPKTTPFTITHLRSRQ